MYQNFCTIRKEVLAVLQNQFVLSGKRKKVEKTACRFLGRHLVDWNTSLLIFSLIERTSADILTAKLVDKSDLRFVGKPPKRESISFLCWLENWPTLVNNSFKRLKKNREPNLSWTNLTRFSSPNWEAWPLDPPMLLFLELRCLTELPVSVGKQELRQSVQLQEFCGWRRPVKNLDN